MKTPAEERRDSDSMPKFPWSSIEGDTTSAAKVSIHSLCSGTINFPDYLFEPVRMMCHVEKPIHEPHDPITNPTSQIKMETMVKARLKDDVTIPAETNVYFFEEYIEQIDSCLTDGDLMNDE